MPLRLVNKERTQPIQACDTTFQLISLAIGEKEQLVYELTNIGPEYGAFSRLLDIITPVISSIEGYDGSVRKTLDKLEDIDQLRTIVQAIIKHCSLTEDESKNSPSSSEQPTPESAGNADQNAAPDVAPASTTQT